MGQEAFDAECAALARALQVAATRNHTIRSVTVFTDAQAAIWRMSSDGPEPGQKYALEMYESKSGGVRATRGSRATR